MEMRMKKDNELRKLYTKVELLRRKKQMKKLNDI